jgi:hypothetical protein
VASAERQSFGAQRPNQPQTRLGVGEDPHHARAPLHLFVEPLRHFGRSCCHLVSHAAKSRLASCKSRQSSIHRNFCRQSAIRLARQTVQGVAQQLHIAALPDRRGGHLADGLLQPGIRGKTCSGIEEPPLFAELGTL